MKTIKYNPVFLSAFWFKALFASVLIVALSFQGFSAPQKNNQDFTVVIDAGHGGHDHGAVDNGAREKDINLGVATKLCQLIKKGKKNVKVVMTRDDDTFVSLQERANIANRNKGNLFISIHTNSVDKSNPNRRSVSGASVYALGPQKDANNLKVAQRENSVIELEKDYHQKYSGFDPNKDESYIIFEMAQKKTLGKSLKFADLAQKELVKTSGRKDRGVKQAGFWVLWATSMPSVLVELDFICNPQSAEYLASESGQQKMATSLYNALCSYIGTNQNMAVTKVSKENAFDTPVAEVASGQQYIEENVTASIGGSAHKRTVTAAPQTVAKKTTINRRRRSESSKQMSDQRDLETGEILLKSESAYIAEVLPRQSASKEAPEGEEKTNDAKDKKSKKGKAKNKPDNKKETVNSKKQSASRHANHKKGTNQKTFVVATNGAATNTKSSKVSGSTDASQTTARPQANKHTATGKMVYKVQIAALDHEVSLRDPVFCGITPTGSFVENGLYKYTVFSCSDRREIESKLLEVKTKIPDAFIVVRAE